MSYYFETHLPTHESIKTPQCRLVHQLLQTGNGNPLILKECIVVFLVYNMKCPLSKVFQLIGNSKSMIRSANQVLVFGVNFVEVF